MKHYKVLFADLDGTLIDTISGNTFPKGIWDFRFKFDVLDKLKQLNPKRIYIVTNQGGVSCGFIKEFNLKTKLNYISKAIEEYTGISTRYDYCISNDKNDKNRKPNTGMLEFFHEEYCDAINCSKSEILMIGDASGKEGQFSDSDKRCAKNYGIDYLDVNDFINI